MFHSTCDAVHGGQIFQQGDMWCVLAQEKRSFSWAYNDVVMNLHHYTDVPNILEMVA